MYKMNLVTYLRSNECVNENIRLIINTLKDHYSNVKIIIFVDRDRKDISEQVNIPFELINLPGTKYRRIKKILETEEDSILISIDNDTTIIPETFLDFVSDFVEKNKDIGWARIKAVKQKSFISRMVSVDKLLSHTIIRPILWKLKIGISIPGQLFIIKSSAFRNKLFDVDTFLDDLALGLYVNLNFKNLNVLMSNKVIAMEMPKTSFHDLCNQRKRWAKGYYTICKGINGKKEKHLIMWHGFAYHFSWIINWMIMIILGCISWPFSIIYLFLMSFFLSRKDMTYFLDSIIYQIFFPIFHIVWITYFIKGEKNENNA